MATMKMDCNFKKIGLMLLSFSLVSWKNRQKLIIVLRPFVKIIQFLSLDVLGAFCVQEGYLI